MRGTHDATGKRAMWSLAATVFSAAVVFDALITTLQAREWDAVALAFTPLSACLRFFQRRAFPVSTGILLATAYMAFDAAQTHIFEGVFHVWHLYKQVEFLLYRTLWLLVLRVALHLAVHRRGTAPKIQQGAICLGFLVEASRVVCPLQTSAFVGQAVAYSVCSVAEGRAAADDMVLSWLVVRYLLTTPAPLL